MRNNSLPKAFTGSNIAFVRFALTQNRATDVTKSLTQLINYKRKYIDIL